MRKDSVTGEVLDHGPESVPHALAEEKMRARGSLLQRKRQGCETARETEEPPSIGESVGPLHP